MIAHPQKGGMHMPTTIFLNIRLLVQDYFQLFLFFIFFFYNRGAIKPARNLIPKEDALTLQ